MISKKELNDSLVDLGYQGDNIASILNDLTSSSKVAVWRLWLYTVAVSTHFLEQLWDLYKSEINTKLKAKPGTEAWLAGEALKFQYGDVLIYNNDGTYGYAEKDDEKQIVKRSAVTTSFNKTIVKVAKLVNDAPVELNNDELGAFQGYLNEIQYAGTTLIASSTAGDALRIELEVYYNAVIPLATTTANVESAINAYIAELDFAGTFRISTLVDRVQAVEGVIDIVVDQITAKPAGSVHQDVTRVYDPESGYLTIDPQYPLSTQGPIVGSIQYTPE
jgi:hypothetical protein